MKKSFHQNFSSFGKVFFFVAKFHIVFAFYKNSFLEKMRNLAKELSKHKIYIYTSRAWPALPSEKIKIKVSESPQKMSTQSVQPFDRL